MFAGVVFSGEMLAFLERFQIILNLKCCLYGGESLIYIFESLSSCRQRDIRIEDPLDNADRLTAHSVL